ncbi:hypothetical protein [Alkalicoccobacillus porphyridii]|uniref:Uncharacterized protein n=1 Tax=Alkalicoccobacillus porphyridii TaxID=2597270 RepID=A0A554A0A8_9BACI|nr:hypothetical protein [Alkalicoccobacillus porphyridii]TSB47134.1 hypothetical protein FN960_08980 [Alkalicoccobacillus porphyridii]
MKIHKQLSKILKEESSSLRKKHYKSFIDIEVECDLASLDTINKLLRLAEADKAFQSQSVFGHMAAFIAITFTIISFIFNISNKDFTEMGLFLFLFILLIVLILYISFRLEFRRINNYKATSYFIEYLRQQKELRK